MNISVMDTSVMMPNRIIGIDGGIMIPSVPADIMRPSENSLLYPAPIIAGYMIEPIASMVTIDDPEMAAKTAQPSTAATPRPPGIGAVSSTITLIRR